MLLYGIKTFWHPVIRQNYDVYTTPDRFLVLQTIGACQFYNVSFETFVTYSPRFS